MIQLITGIEWAFICWAILSMLTTLITKYNLYTIQKFWCTKCITFWATLAITQSLTSAAMAAFIVYIIDKYITSNNDINI